MTEASEGAPSDRWQELIQTFDPERNVRAFADLLKNAAATSEQVIGSMVASGSTATGDQDGLGTGAGSPLREAITQIERSVAQFYEVAGRFMVERPIWNGAASNGGVHEIVVVDGVGTTSVEVPGLTGAPVCGELRSHDGQVLDAGVVRIVESEAFESDHPTFVVRVDVPAETPAGLYHGQMLVPGHAETVIGLAVKVIAAET